jgi:hypothetical protein
MTTQPQNATRSWWQDEPRRLAREQAAMIAAAPDLAWLPEEPSGGWQGTVPMWPFNRPQPRGLNGLLGSKQLEVRIVCGHAFPMVEPLVRPLSVEVPWQALGWTSWHVAPDGSLCLFQASAQWDPSSPVADLIPKISGWYIEYHLMLAARIEAMTESGLAADDSLDVLISALETKE